MSGLIDTSGLAGVRKAAILLSVLGEEPASVILGNLSEEEMHRVANEVANLGQISSEVSLQIFEEFRNMTQAHDFLQQGGRDMARRLLVKAIGEDEAEAILERLDKARQVTPLEALQRADPQKLAKFLEGEHPQAIALVLGQLGERQASALLMNLPATTRSEAVRRLAALKRFSPEMAARVSTALSHRLKTVGEQGRRSYSGFQSVADIMNCMDTTVAQEILENIEAEEPQLAISIRDLMFTFNDLLQVEEGQIRELMNAVDKKMLAAALKGCSEDLKNHFFRTMSSRAVEMLKEDIDSLGPMRSKEVVKAQSDIVAIARQLEAEGKMVLKGEGSDEYVV